MAGYATDWTETTIVIETPCGIVEVGITSDGVNGPSYSARFNDADVDAKVSSAVIEDGTGERHVERDDNGFYAEDEDDMDEEIRAMDLRVGDVYEDEDSDERIQVERQDQHGDTVLIWGTQDGQPVERSYDIDEVVVLQHRQEVS